MIRKIQEKNRKVRVKHFLITICLTIDALIVMVYTIFSLCAWGGGQKENPVVFLNHALDSLGYDRDILEEKENDKILYLEKFAQILYQENPLGVENISFKYYIQNIKERGGGISNEEFEYATDLLVDTERYIIEYNITMEEYEGTDYNNERYNPERIGKNIEEIDVVYDYDYNLLNAIEEKYFTIDRKRALAGIFFKICKREDSNLKRHQKIWEFCSKVSAHSNYLQPMNKEGEMVCDPIVLLELHEMRCGQIARVACDLFNAVGYQTRLVQLGGHIIAEIYYDQSWHYLDSDMWNSYQAVEENGIIPSVETMSLSPYLIDGLANNYYETYMWGINKMGESQIYPSYYYFNKEAYAYSGGSPAYYYKKATEEQELNWQYGWNYYETIDADIKLDAEKFEQPSAPYIEKVEVYEKKAIIAWLKEKEDKSDIIGYKVFVSRTSRGWEYANLYGDTKVKDFVINRYDPSQYDKITQLPCSEIYNIDTIDTEIELNLEKGIYYISIIPYDAHGESIDKEIYLMSNELRIEIK